MGSESAMLAKKLETIFERQSAGSHAWKVTLQDGELSWSDGQSTFDSDPKASAWLRFQAWGTRALGLDAQL